MIRDLVSIIIRTYNESEHLEQLLDAISKQVYSHYEVIIVDSGSDDNTLEIAKKFRFVRTISIEKKDFSFGYALNLGIEKSNGEFCLFISGHCIPLNNEWLYEMIKPFIISNRIGLVYGRQIGVPYTKFSEHMIFEIWFPDKFNHNQTHPFCNNANTMIRKSIWQNGLIYDESVLGLEDLVFAKQLLDIGYKIVYNPNSTVQHIHNEKYRSIRTRYEREATTYYSVYPKQTFDIIDTIKLSVLNIFNDISELYKTKLYKFDINNIVSIFLFRTNQFYGTYKGYKINKEIKRINTYEQELRKKFYYPK